MKRVDRAAIDLSYTADIFTYDLPQTFDEVKFAVREFETLGRDLNGILEIVVGRRSNIQNHHQSSYQENDNDVNTIRSSMSMSNSQPVVTEILRVCRLKKNEIIS